VAGSSTLSSLAPPYLVPASMLGSSKDFAGFGIKISSYSLSEQHTLGRRRHAGGQQRSPISLEWID
jgi:hypothetical protein